jgi:hypothetical protein
MRAGEHAKEDRGIAGGRGRKGRLNAFSSVRLPFSSARSSSVSPGGIGNGDFEHGLDRAARSGALGIPHSACEGRTHCDCHSSGLIASELLAEGWASYLS